MSGKDSGNDARNENGGVEDRGDPALGIEEDPSERSELRSILSDLVGRADLVQRELDSDLEKLERVYQEAVYSELIYLLSHLRFAPGEAHQRWQNISRYRQIMEDALQSRVDPRVALIHYFLGVEPSFKNPKVIEMSLFERTRDSAYRDELTGLYNYRFFSEHLTREIARSRRRGSTVSLLMADLDEFKRFNDEHGHVEGNTGLANVARWLLESVRQEDLVTRYGGEEFAIILPATPKKGARVTAERLRSAVERQRLRLQDGKQVGLTITIGVATFPADADDAHELVRQADRALYEAKAGGKNRVGLCDSSTRSHVRSERALSGRVRTLATEHHGLTTVTISDGGMLLQVDRDLPVGSLVEIDLVLPETQREVRIPGQVLSVDKKECGTYEASVRTAEIAMQDRSILARYLAS